MNRPARRQAVSFDRSAVDAIIRYARDKSVENLMRLISTPGGKLAYAHYRWSNVTSRSTIKVFWKNEAEQTRWNEQLETSIEETIRFLEAQRRQWLAATLKYLPPGHVFNTTVYLLGGYDNVVHGEDVALNLAFKKFHDDRREAAYYLIHELAHAGYLRYHRMPDLAGLRTTRDLADTVRFLTHLEGMGVVTPFKKRLIEGGLRDDDYKALLNENESSARVHEYFTKLSELESLPNRRLRKEDYQTLDQFSAGPKRLWYVVGGHMALRIEDRYGTAALCEIVRKGHESFFRTFLQIENPLSL